MRAKDSATGSIATAMWKALAWIMLLRPRAMATWPFQKIRSPCCRAGEAYGLAERGLLHVAVARASARRKRSAPPGRAPSSRARGWSCRPRGRACRESARRPRRNPAPPRQSAQDAARHDSRPIAVTAKLASSRATAILAPSGSASVGGSLIDGPGNTSVRSAATLWVGARSAAPAAPRRQPADVAVARELAPGPAVFVGLIDGDALAHQRFGEQRRAVRGVGAHRRGAGRRPLARSPSTKRAASTLPRSWLAARSGRAGVRRGSNGAASAVARAEQRIERARRLAFAAFRAAGLRRRRPGVDVEMQPGSSPPRRSA